MCAVMPMYVMGVIIELAVQKPVKMRVVVKISQRTILAVLAFQIRVLTI